MGVLRKPAGLSTDDALGIVAARRGHPLTRVARLHIQGVKSSVGDAGWSDESLGSRVTPKPTDQVLDAMPRAPDYYSLEGWLIFGLKVG